MIRSSYDRLAAEALGVNQKQGLSSVDIIQRRERYGANTLQSIRPRSAWRILLEQFASLVRRLMLTAKARSIALMSLVGVQLADMFNCRSHTRSAFDRLFRNRFIWAAIAIVIGLQLLAAYLTPLARVLQTVRPT
jgi:magnesium-transporting ATPase (P-type)